MKKRFASKPLIPLFALILSFTPSLGLGWGREGHEVVARVAQSLLKPRTVRALDALRKTGKASAFQVPVTAQTPPFYTEVDQNLVRFFDPGKPLELSLVSDWADAWKGNHKETGPWHFIDIPAGSKIPGPDELEQFCPHGSCVVDQIRIQREKLAKRSLPADQRLLALFFLVHLVADIHQPLHCASDEFINLPLAQVPPRHDGDNGGNLKQVRFFGEVQNLHHIWDDSILERHGAGAQDTANRIKKGLTATRLRQWQAGTSGDWALESHAIAMEKIYENFPHDGSAPDYGQAYENEMAPLVEERLARAGVRLAWLLNGIF